MCVFIQDFGSCTGLEGWIPGTCGMQSVSIDRIRGILLPIWCCGILLMAIKITFFVILL